jgi:hypothetical protein
MEKSKKGAKKPTITPIDEINKIVNRFSSFAQKMENAGNYSMAKHYLVKACEIVLKDREHCNATDKQIRAALAQKLIARAKMLKNQVSQKINMMRRQDKIFDQAFTATYVDPENIKINFDQIIG